MAFKPWFSIIDLCLVNLFFFVEMKHMVAFIKECFLKQSQKRIGYILKLTTITTFEWLNELPTYVIMHWRRQQARAK